jgi:FKBP-type peptidyl-prolyl cis-trans isomerase
MKINTFLKVCAFVLFVTVIASGCKKADDPYAAYTPEREAGLIKAWLDAQIAAKKNIDTTSTGIFYIVEKVGSGATVKTGNKITVNYTGMFTDGTVFDSSKGYSYVHKGSSSRMIQGWEEGIEVLNKGERATFLIPSAKAYGSTGYSSIPPNSPLIFVIEVVDIK